MRRVCLALGACVITGVLGTADADAETVVLSPGPEQTFVVPSGVTHIKVAAVGEKGHNICLFGRCFRGLSEQATATLSVNPGQKLYADFVGAGAGSGVAARGGNSADLRTIPSGEAGSLGSRLIVAGGGGGEGEVEEGSSPGQGGNAGAGEGEAGTPATPAGGGAGGGGTQKNGGGGGAAAGGTAGEAGQLGRGGNGGTGSPAGDAGGGGGGYYGGGGGGGGEFAGGGGGGGSSFVAAGAEEPSFTLNSAEAAAGITITYAGGTETVIFNPSGSEQSFVVPVGVSRMSVVATAANGEDRCGCGAGLGEKARAAFSAKPGQQFFIDFLGGGSSNSGGSGGNAADLRTVSRSQAGSLASRLIVAGGGGGSGLDEENSIGGTGGNAGFAEGATGGSALAGAGGGGGTQKNGGAGGKGEANGEAGQLGQGGKGGTNTEGDGAGGGGGYYGGGGGAGGGGGTAGGGGGSSFAAASAEEVSATLNGSKEQSSLSISYKSASPPTVSITTPAEGASYSQGQVVDAAYSCSEGAGGPGLKPGSEGCSGPVANGAAIDTSTTGAHSFTVTATSQDGLTASKTVTYTVESPVAPPPTVTAISPSSGRAAGGTVVTITGSGFTGASAVKFGPTAAQSFEVQSDSSISAVAPARRPGTAAITVTVAAVTSLKTKADVFRYLPESPPELGRCLKVAKGAGKYASGCAVRQSAGSFEWMPEALKRGFSSSGGKSVLETAAKTQIVCSGEQTSGEYSGSKEVSNVTLTLRGCELKGARCTSAGAGEGEVKLSELEGVLGWNIEEKNAVALDLFALGKAPHLVDLSCGATSVSIDGSILAPIAPINTMRPAFKLTYRAAKGKQKPEHLEGQANDVLELSLAAGPFEQAGLSIQSTTSTEEAIRYGNALTGEEALEINTVV
jgi:IPT/TIG domain/Glycine rich protein